MVAGGGWEADKWAMGGQNEVAEGRSDEHGGRGGVRSRWAEVGGVGEAVRRQGASRVWRDGKTRAGGL